MYGENTNTMVIPIYRILLYTVIIMLMLLYNIKQVNEFRRDI